MAATTHIYSLEYAATIMDQALELLEAIVWNDDNLTYGSIITALTDYDIKELTGMLRDDRISTKTCREFLDNFVNDAELVARLKAQSSR